MLTKKGLVITLLILILLMTACDPMPQPLPTSVPVAELPPPTTTSLPPTTDLTELPVTAAPTPVPPTRQPTATATATSVKPFITITKPDENVDIVLGNDILVRGLAQHAGEQSAWLSLVSLNGRLLAEAQAVVSEQSWESGFNVPPFVSGAANLQATIRDEEGNVLAEYRTAVNLVIDTNTTDRFLALYRPLREETAVSGFNIIFDGMVYRPTNSAITISVWVDDCQTRVARQSFALGRTPNAFYWQGFAIIPQEITGPACAIAHFGEPGSEDWREAVVPINILSTDNSEAKGIHIGNPPPDSHVTAGHELYLYGTALNVSEKPVSVSILMENGRIISQSAAPADYWGYWEFLVILPVDVSGPAKITVSAGDTDNDAHAEAQILIHVDPAPTPES